MASTQGYSEKEKQHGSSDDDSLSFIPKNGGISTTKIVVIFVFFVQALFILKLWSMIPKYCTLDPHNKDTTRRKWHRNTSYMSLDHEYDHLWNETGRSALVFDDYESVVQITMQVQVTTQRQTSLLLARFHELHCLAAIRKALQDAREGHDIGLDEKDNSHWPHCLQFLREAILCTADDTLEHRAPNGTVFSGYLDERTCGSAAKLYEYRDARKIYNYDGSLVSTAPWNG
ncbi:hypothetical protein BDV96DRAFT_600790 [Lophiotrema nucula]|uniref:Uncharacterized protein n=1 Tax=Lophiotrema nucula TaxID=690887 RepID=A0A6A5Z3Q8_9PLEO|nr:hypothetical protein BDV96DRAFT_600790 [Lophiotrema nucula]